MKKKNFVVTIVLITLILITGLFTNYTDSARVRNGVEPIYTLKVISNNGDKITYIGLGYKVIRYVSVSPNEPYKNNRGVKYGSWFMSYSLDESE